jgi:transcriptional regulator with XRE-family HTH domain
MQDLSAAKSRSAGRPDNQDMSRPLSRHRPAQGARLRDLRIAAGLTQEELGRLVGMPQGNIAFWELSDKPPRSEILVKLATALGVRIEALLNGHAAPVRRGGPVGKARETFERVSRLPRRQQEHILGVVEALLKQAENGKVRA